MNRLVGSHAVITGGSSGLGEAYSTALARRGASVVLMARNEDRLAAAAVRVQAAAPGADVRTASVDVRDAEAVNTAFADLRASHGPIDLLINNAGVLHEGHVDRIPLDLFREVMEIDYLGPLHTTLAALPQLVETKGRLVNVASVAGLLGVFGYSAYCSGKHALVGLTQSLRYELEPRGVHVHLVCPPEFDSPMVASLDQTRTPQNRAHTLTIPKVSAETVVRETLSGLASNRYLIVPGRRTRLALRANALVPALGHGLARRRIAAASR